jgi:type IV pilus assembly protein PilX
MNTTRSLRTQLPLRGRQAGATLIVGLVLLLVLTVVGVSGMNTATMEITMAANTQFQQDAFQAAEDAIDIALTNRNYTTNPADARNTVNWLGNADYDRRAQTVYLEGRNTIAPGSSFGPGGIEAFHFDITSVGRGPRNALSEHTQSFYVPGRAL